MTLLAASASHAEALAAIHAESFPPEGRWGATAMGLQLSLPGAFGLIDPVGGMVLARTVADEAEILTLAVAPALRRQGCGRRLMQAAMAEAGGRGAGSMVLEAGTANLPAQALYLSLGFVRVGLRRGYYAGGEDALILRAPLSGSDISASNRVA